MSNTYKIKEYFQYDLYTKKMHLFKSMIGRFFGKDSHQIIKEIGNKINTSGKLKNDDFYQIYKKFIRNKPPQDTKTLLNAETNRQKKHMSIILELFKNTKYEFDKNTVYVDYGCNDGALTIAVVKLFNLNPKNVYCFDLIDQPELVKLAGYNYIKIDTKNLENIFKNIPKINLLTIINVLHHMNNEDRIDLTTTLNKKLSNCYTIIKEHNCNLNIFDTVYRNLITEWHNLYVKLRNEANFMGEIDLISYNHVKIFMYDMHSTCIGYIPDQEYDILRSYMALFVQIPKYTRQ